MMTNGQTLSQVITNVLSTLDLSVEQKAKLNKTIDSNLGRYNPVDIEEDLLEINDMYYNKDVDGLLLRLKVYPLPAEDKSIIFYIDGHECSIADYCKSDTFMPDSVRTFKAQNMKELEKPYKEMSLDEYSNTTYGAKFFGLGKVVMLDYWVIYNLNRHIIDNNLLDSRIKGKYGTVDKIRAKHTEVISYLNKVVSSSKLVTSYLSVEWCGNKPKKGGMGSPTATEILPAKTYDGVVGELTEVGITDAELDAMDNTMVGVSKSGELLNPKGKKKFKKS